MKSSLFIFVGFFIIPLCATAQTSKRVLFLGNSYTNVNNLPQLIADLAISVGDTLIFDSNMPGGYTLQGHSSNTTSLQKIMVGHWDAVVLQEQSQLPSFPAGQVQTDVFPYARLLDSLINHYNPCAETMFYMTWGRKNGDVSNCASWPPVCTYAGMDSLLHLRYMTMAIDNHAAVTPVGAVWRYIRQHHPNLDLYQADESHPSAAGSYAAACSFYTSLFKKNPQKITANYSLSATDAATIRAATKTIIYDSLRQWYIGEYDPMAQFSFSTNGNTISFANLSTNASTYQWDFGDGNTSTATHPTYTFLQNGTYSVRLIALHCGIADTTTQTLSISTVSSIGQTVRAQHRIVLYPHPCSTAATLSLANHVFENTTLTVLNVTGQVVHQQDHLSGETLVFYRHHLPSGFYMICLAENGQTIATSKLTLVD